MSHRLNVKTAYANIYSEPTFSSQLVTQALFFESVEVISEHDNWYKISQWDGYVGYVHRFYLSEFDLSYSKSYTVTDRFQSLHSKPSSDGVAMIVPFGAEIPIVGVQDGWSRTAAIDNREFFFKSEADSVSKENRSLILKFAESLLGSPYLWGGKTPFGYDCSGFVQSIYKAVGIKIKRDTSVQIKDVGIDTIDLDLSQKGDLVFFSIDGNGVDHVGIMYNRGDIIHCSGEVKIQSLDDDTHIKLRDYVIEVKSIGKLVDE